MKKEESTQLKEGQTVYIAVKYLGTTTDGESAHVEIQTTDWMDIGLNSVVSISPNVSFEHIVIPSPVKENKPKYDPCRKFKMGDIVEYVEVNGRDYKDAPPLGKQCRVFKDETDGFVVVNRLDFNVVYRYEVPFYHLKLVTPVEELEPYYVSTNIDCSTCTIFKKVGEKKLVYSSYHFVHGNGCKNAIMGITEAKAAAEAECARLNAEYRKEQA